MQNTRERKAEGAFTPWVAGFTVAGAVLFIALAAAWYWPTPELAFLSDNSPVSWLSSAQLWTIALLSLRLGADRSLPVLTSAWMALAMMLLACDEQFMLHEHWKYGCYEWFDACRNHHWMTEAPILAVAIAGAATVAHLHCLLRDRGCRLWLWSSLTVASLAILVDLTGWPPNLARLEEVLEVVAEALFAGTLLGWRRVVPIPDQEHSTK
jgi:hypothetical protein